MKTKYFGMKAIVLIALVFLWTGCKRDVELEIANGQNSGQASSTSVAIPTLYDALDAISTDDWTPLPVYKETPGLPFTHVRRSEMMERDFHATLFDGVSFMAITRGLLEAITTTLSLDWPQPWFLQMLPMQQSIWIS